MSNEINRQVIMKTRPVGMPVLENFEIIECVQHFIFIISNCI